MVVIQDRCGFESDHAQHILKNNEASKSHSGKTNYAYKVEILESIGLAIVDNN